MKIFVKTKCRKCFGTGEILSAKCWRLREICDLCEGAGVVEWDFIDLSNLDNKVNDILDKCTEELRVRNAIEDKLDKIIRLLELRNSIADARNELTKGIYSVNPYPELCTCSQKGTAVEVCPKHG